MQTESISELIQSKARHFGPKLALCMRGGDPAERYTYRELDVASGKLAAAFVDMGLEPDDRVAVLCEPRPRWGAAFFAILRAGGVVLPLDTRSSVVELQPIFAEAKPKVLIVSALQEKTAAELTRLYGDDMRVISVEAAGRNSSYPSIDFIESTHSFPCIGRDANDAAVLTYTSGTMGVAKGVVTTYGNLLFQIRTFRTVMQNDAHSKSVSILPLSHLFELTAGFLGLLYGGGQVCYVNSLLPDEITGAMRDQQVTCMVTVPLFLKLIVSAIRKEVARQSLLKRSLFRVISRIAPLFPVRLRRRLFRPIHRKFGGRLEYFVCGGAPLELDTLKFFENIGLPVYQGYGLAETSPVIATNGPTGNRAGSVGKPLPGIEVRISNEDGGEILTRGPHVMRGYFHKDELTADIIDADGWLHTGDLGQLDRDGYLFISGRKKNVIVLGSGKNVQPEELEATLFEHPDIQEGCVVGTVASKGLLKGSEEVCAVAVASDDAIRRCSKESEDIKETLRHIIEQRALQLSPCKRPTRIVLRMDPLPRTSTRKVRRLDLQNWLTHQGVLM
jgi:long-chain acyl-CoA synthetase